MTTLDQLSRKARKVAARDARSYSRKKWLSVHAVDIAFVGIGLFIWGSLSAALLLAPLASWGFLLIWTPVTAIFLVLEGLCLLSDPCPREREAREERWNTKHNDR